MHSKVCLTDDGHTTNDLGSPSFQCNTKWLSTVVTENIYCKYSQGYVAKAHNEDTISNLGKVTHCDYDKVFCFDDEDQIYIKYIPNRKEALKYVEVGTYNVTVINGHILIPTLGLSFKLKGKNSVQRQGYFKVILEEKSLENSSSSLKSETDKQPILHRRNN